MWGAGLKWIFDSSLYIGDTPDKYSSPVHTTEWTVPSAVTVPGTLTDRDTWTRVLEPNPEHWCWRTGFWRERCSTEFLVFLSNRRRWQGTPLHLRYTVTGRAGLLLCFEPWRKKVSGSSCFVACSKADARGVSACSSDTNPTCFYPQTAQC